MLIDTSELDGEVGGEFLDDAADVEGKPLEVAEACSGLANAYAEGRISLHAHLRVWSRTGVLDRKDLCLTVVPERLESGADPLARVGVDDEQVVQSLAARKIHCKVGQVDKSMLVVVREVSERGERMDRAWWYPSTVGLCLVDECLMGVGDALQPPLSGAGRLLPVLPSRAPIVRARVANRKLVASAGSLLVDKDELPDEVIESGSQIVDRVPEHDAPQEEVIQGLEQLPLEDILSAVQAEIAGDFVRLRIDPRLADPLGDCVVEVLQMFHPAPLLFAAPI